MEGRRPTPAPLPKRPPFRRAAVLEAASVLAVLTAVAVLYAAMGASLAVRAVWTEHLLRLAPAAAFGLAARGRAPAPAVTAAVLIAGGGFLLFDAAASLAAGRRPTFGLFGYAGDVWSGWVMLGALAAAAAPRALLGLAGRAAPERAGAAMDRAAPLTAAAAALGVLGAGFGLWWADAAAAAAVGLVLTRNGLRYARRA